jgi:competence protein ComGC
MLHFFAKRLKKLHEVERDERGFTLIELLIVVYGSFTILLAAPYVEGVVALS